MQQAMIKFIEIHKKEINNRWMNQNNLLQQEYKLRAISEEVYATTSQQFFKIIMDILQSREAGVEYELREYTDKFMQAGWPLVYFTKGLQLFRSIVVELLSEEEADVSVFIERFQEIEKRIDDLTNKLVHEYTGSWETTLEMQKLSLLELSAPLIPVFESISVMPLIGTIDTTRARLIMENLLNGVIKHRSQVVLIDITGVPIVDTMVANHIIQAAEAVRLIGADCILVGIRPEIAQTIVNLGIDLTNFPTKSTLKKGIETALEVTNKKVIEL